MQDAFGVERPDLVSKGFLSMATRVAGGAKTMAMPKVNSLIGATNKFSVKHGGISGIPGSMANRIAPRTTSAVKTGLARNGGFSGITRSVKSGLSGGISGGIAGAQRGFRKL